MSLGENSQTDLDPPQRRSSWRRWVGVGLTMLLLGAIAGLVLNQALSGPSVEVIDATFQAATADLDGIAVEGEDGEFDLSHAAGVECLPEMAPGDAVRLGVANIDRSDADIPFVAKLNQDRVVLWVECLAGGG